jgi:predicted amidohydrolase YtcJ
MNREAPVHESLLVLADRIHTLADPHPCRALLLHGGTVAAAGDPGVLRRQSPGARVLDLSGTTITPGLTDAHVHLTEWAVARTAIDLTHADSPDDAARAVAHRARTIPTAWLRGRGWNPHRWHGAQPHRTILDALLPDDRPVLLQSHDMHALWVNTAALRAAGIDAATPDPAGGAIIRDADGPTGLLLEAAGQLVVRAAPPADHDDVVAAVDAAQAALHAHGITGVHSFPGIHLRHPDHLLVLRRLRDSGALRLRVAHQIALEQLDEAIADGVRSGAGDAWLRAGGVKLFLDGALGSRTAWMRAPYEDGSGSGIMIMEPAAFREQVRRAAAAGIAASVHAIGDAAVSLALTVLGDPDLRVAGAPHRIEHMQCCPPDRLGDAAAAGVVCSMQPSHLMTDWPAADRCWGADRCTNAFPIGALLRHGALLAFGSDAPVEPVDPRRGLHAAVCRTDEEGMPAGGWYPAQRVGARDALLGYTAGPARAAGLPAPFGSLGAGAPADFAAWDRDPLASDGSLLTLRCVAAMVAGDLVHSS